MAGEKIGQHGPGQRHAELIVTDMRVAGSESAQAASRAAFSRWVNSSERLILKAGGVAVVAEAAVAESIRYAKERHARQADPELPEHEVRTRRVQDRRAGRQDPDGPLIQRHLDGTPDAATASMAKLWGSDKQCEIVDRCLQVFGGYGYMMEYPDRADVRRFPRAEDLRRH